MPSPIRFTGTPFLTTRTLPTAYTLRARSSGSSPADQLTLSPAATAAQRELDTIAAQLNRASLSRGRDDSGFAIQNTSTALTQFRVRNANLEPGQSIDANIEVTQSAQRGGLIISFGQQLPGYHPGSVPYTVELKIAGADGEQVVHGVSGTPMSAMVAAVNFSSDQTGLQASAGPTGLIIRSTGYGSDEFVSVEATVMYPNGVRESGTIYQFMGDDANTVDPQSGVTFSTASVQTSDAGQNIQATLNGQPTESYGTRITYTGPAFTTQLDLATGFLGKGQTANAQNLGSFLAFTLLHSNEQPGPLDTHA